MNDFFDLVVIGAGPGGYPAALEAAKMGKSVAVIDRGAAGGTCLNSGCIPMKTLLHASRLYRESSHNAALAQSLDHRFSMETLGEYRKHVIKTLSEGIETQFKKAGVVFIHGTAHITGEHEVLISSETDRRLSCTHILIATGAQPVHLPIPGIDLPGIENSMTLLDGDRLYESLIIIGGGVIAMEFASFYTDLGIPVTILEAADHILPGMDVEIGRNLKMILQKRGAAVYTGVTVTRIESAEDQKYTCFFSAAGSVQSITANGVLVAAGRRPAGTDVCSAEIAAALKIENGRIPVTSEFRTAIPSIYAVGDVSGNIQLAHAATAAGLTALAELYACPQLRKNIEVIPSCVYSDPEIACVGMTESAATAAGIATVTGRYTMSVNGKSVLSGQDRGFIKIVAECHTRHILGAQLMCDRATDCIGMLQLAVARQNTVDTLAELVIAHPSFAEGIAEAAADCGKRMGGK